MLRFLLLKAFLLKRGSLVNLVPLASGWMFGGRSLSVLIIDQLTVHSVEKMSLITEHKELYYENGRFMNVV